MSLPPRGLKNLSVGQEKNRWHQEGGAVKRKWKNTFTEVGHPRRRHFCIQCFCFVDVNFYISMFPFQGSLMLNEIIYRCCLVLFPAFSFPGKSYRGERRCTHFENLPLLPQTDIPLPVLMEVLTCLAEPYRNSN